jgi:thiol-disulfide isomerase/thioredoxin
MIARLLLVLAVVAAQTPDSLFRPSDHTRAIVFVASDCPISNGYAPEIQRICTEFAQQGVRCTLVYEDEGITPAAVQSHLAEYRYQNVATLIDDNRSIARHAGATVTPEAVVLDTRGEIKYRGRIDNFYAALGKPRQRATTHELRDALAAVVAGRRVERPRTEALGCYITRNGVDK